MNGLICEACRVGQIVCFNCLDVYHTSLDCDEPQDESRAREDRFCAAVMGGATHGPSRVIPKGRFARFGDVLGATV